MTSRCNRFLATFGSGTFTNIQVGWFVGSTGAHPAASRRPANPIVAKSLDAFGSRGRPSATAQKVPTFSASAQSNVREAMLTVMVTSR
jgi:hypothetical protein